MIDRRDIGVGLVSLIGGLGLISGLLYYSGGSSALNPVFDIWPGLARRIGLAVPPAPLSRPGENSAVATSPGEAVGQPVRPQPAPAGAAATGVALRVKLNNLTLHRCPGYDCETIASLPLGATVTLLGERDGSPGEEWCRVRAGTREGWVSRYYLE